jgi:hypothetical protein
MAHMRPEVTTKQDWAGVETNSGFWWVPFDILSKSEVESVKRGDYEPLLKYTEGTRVHDSLSSVKKGYGVRLSAPGYMDATDWEVYGSAKEAQRRARELVEEGEGDHATKKRSTKKSPAQLDREIAQALKKSSSGRHHSSMVVSDDEKIRDAIGRFPRTFGLRGFPGDVFRISPTSSYIDDSRRVVLYTQRKTGNQWLDFSKGSESELRREVTP